MSQKYKIEEYACNLEMVAQRFKEEAFEGKNDWDAREVRDKFKSILAKIEFSHEDMSIYKSKRKEDGQFIFSIKSNLDDVVERLKELFLTDYKSITYADRCRIQDDMFEILPLYHNSGEYAVISPDNNPTIPAATQRKGDKCEGFLQNRSDDKELICKKVNRLYERTRSIECYERSLFVWEPELTTNQSGRYEFHIYQYSETNKWAERWKSLMDDALRMRMVDRFNQYCKFLVKKRISDSERHDFLKSGIIGNEDLKKEYSGNSVSTGDLLRYLEDEIINEETDDKNIETKYQDTQVCHEACVELVKSILNHPLKCYSEEDYYCAIGKAFDELHGIRDYVNQVSRKYVYENVMKSREYGYTPDGNDLVEYERMREVIKGYRQCMV